MSASDFEKCPCLTANELAREDMLVYSISGTCSLHSHVYEDVGLVW